jgi:hypothetical protein
MPFHVSFNPKSIPVSKSHILSDEDLALQPLYGSYGRKYKRLLRLVCVAHPETGEVLELVTNITHLSADTVSEIYKERWQIELLFKTLKQNLRIKAFVGTSSNALHIQIWTALIAMLLLKYLQMRSRVHWVLSNLVALLRWNLFTYRDLRAWIDRGFESPPNQPSSMQASFVLDSK